MLNVDTLDKILIIFICLFFVVFSFCIGTTLEDDLVLHIKLLDNKGEQIMFYGHKYQKIKEK